jgi:exodeoxyribonuclease-5
VFVDGDVFWAKDPLLRRQLLYVAVSRASQAVSLVAGGGGENERALWEEVLRERHKGEGASP